MAKAVAETLQAGRAGSNTHAALPPHVALYNTRMFCQRVKEYNTLPAAGKYTSWAGVFKDCARTSPGLTEALEWAEGMTSPITSFDTLVLPAGALPAAQLNDELWTSLGGVLAGPWESLKRSLKRGSGFELWRRFSRRHIQFGAEHAEGVLIKMQN